VVNNLSISGIDNFSVQITFPGFLRPDSFLASGIRFFPVSRKKPFVPAFLIVNIGVNESVSSFAQVNFTERLSVFEPTIQHQGGNTNFIEPFGNPDIEIRRHNPFFKLKIKYQKAKLRKLFKGFNSKFTL
jgi:hypothetical protein